MNTKAMEAAKEITNLREIEMYTAEKIAAILSKHFPEPNMPVSELAIRKAAQACWSAVPFICASEDFFFDRIKEALREYPVFSTASLRELEEHVNTQNTYQGMRHAVRMWIAKASAQERP